MIIARQRSRLTHKALKVALARDVTANSGATTSALALDCLTGGCRGLLEPSRVISMIRWKTHKHEPPPAARGCLGSSRVLVTDKFLRTLPLATCSLISLPGLPQVGWTTG